MEQLISQLFWAWHGRPDKKDAARKSWDLRFTNGCKLLAKMVHSYRWRTLPGFAIGCLWEHNVRACRGNALVAADAVFTASVQEHECHHPNDPAHTIQIEPNDVARPRILPQSELRECWWRPGEFISLSSTAEQALTEHFVTHS